MTIPRTEVVTRRPATAGAVVHRAALRVDDNDHHLPCDLDDVLHVATREHATVEVWYLHRPGATATTTVRVLGTGHPVPAGARHLGSVIDPGDGVISAGSLVWHLWALDDDTEISR